MNIKINWGTSIFIAFIVFIGFILFMIGIMVSDKRYQHQLVTKDYYKEELDYQRQINMEKRTEEKGYQITVSHINGALVCRFPQSIDLGEVFGTIRLYRPSDKALDFNIPFSKLERRDFFVPDSLLQQGRWDVKVYWTYHGEQYYSKSKILQ